jgi:hypothetical protein
VKEESVADRYKSVQVLEIRNVDRPQFGAYRCQATNDYGQSHADIRLIGFYLILII